LKNDAADYLAMVHHIVHNSRQVSGRVFVGTRILTLRILALKTHNHVVQGVYWFAHLCAAPVGPCSASRCSLRHDRLINFSTHEKLGPQRLVRNFQRKQILATCTILNLIARVALELSAPAPSAALSMKPYVS